MTDLQLQLAKIIIFLTVFFIINISCYKKLTIKLS